MRGSKILTGIILAAVLIAAISVFVNSKTHAQDQMQDQSGIESKLDQILNNEKIIMDQVSSMRQELNVIKIRVTQSQ